MAFKSSDPLCIARGARLSSNERKEAIQTIATTVSPKSMDNGHASISGFITYFCALSVFLCLQLHLCSKAVKPSTISVICLVIAPAYDAHNSQSWMGDLEQFQAESNAFNAHLVVRDVWLVSNEWTQTNNDDESRWNSMIYTSTTADRNPYGFNRVTDRWIKTPTAVQYIAGFKWNSLDGHRVWTSSNELGANSQVNASDHGHIFKTITTQNKHMFTRWLHWVSTSEWFAKVIGNIRNVISLPFFFMLCLCLSPLHHITTHSAQMYILVLSLLTTLVTPCQLAMCDETLIGNGLTYRGCQSKTASGLDCQPWSSQAPNTHGFIPSNYPNAGVGAHNYCRNPDGDTTIWCFLNSTGGGTYAYCEPLSTCDETLDTGDQGLSYRGCQSTTQLGYECQSWSSQSPHAHVNTPSSPNPNNGIGDHNYCRNPDGEATIWCYTTDPTKRWDFCDPLPICDETLSGVNGAEYRGCRDTTYTGKTCQKWTEQTPHSHFVTPSNYPDAGLGDHNYCRNPDGMPTIWCYTTDPNQRFESCLPCDETLSGDGAAYRGCRDTTVTGRTCQKWTKQTPHSHSVTSSNYPDAGIGDHNYCRNPDGEPTIWCYTTDPASRYELCEPVASTDIRLFPPAGIVDHNSCTLPAQCSQKTDFITAWYAGDSFDVDSLVWVDKSGNGHHGIITGSGIGLFHGGWNSTWGIAPTGEKYLNYKPVVYGTTETKIHFGADTLLVSTNHTVFNLCKYISGGTKGRILDGMHTDNFSSSLYGFWKGYAGVAFEQGWITQNSWNYIGETEWILSSQTHHNYRANFIDHTFVSDLSDVADQTFNINDDAINRKHGGEEPSDFACAEIIIVNQELDLDEIKCIEQYFSNKYDLSGHQAIEQPIQTNYYTIQRVSSPYEPLQCSGSTVLFIAQEEANYFAIRCVYDSITYIMDISGDSVGDDVTYSIYDSANVPDSQLWAISTAAAANDVYKIINKQSGLALQFVSEGVAEKQYTYDGKPNQIWTLEYNYYTIESVWAPNNFVTCTHSNNIYADNQMIRGNLTSDSAVVNTQLTITYVETIQDDHYYTIGVVQCMDSGNLIEDYVMDIDGTDIPDPMIYSLFDSSNIKDSQLWKIEVVQSPNISSIINKQSGNALDIYAYGYPLLQWPYLGHVNQLWVIDPPLLTPLANMEPTAAPSDAPSNAPSSTSAPPSFAPSAPPSSAPTTTPSFTPSAPPSSAPSAPPSTAPSAAPSAPPSSAPSAPPSTAPSAAPSMPPSAAPSPSPTRCVENENIFTNDGFERNLTLHTIHLTLMNPVDASKQSIVPNDAGKIKTNIPMVHDGKQELHCGGVVSCYESTISFKNNTLCNLLCDGLLACSTAKINISACDDIHIICNGDESCAGTDITIYSSENADIFIDCGATDSCTDLSVNIFGSANHSQISCYEANSCDNMRISTDAYANSILVMHSHSNNVKFDNSIGFRDLNGTEYVQCNTQNRYIEYESALSDSEIDNLVLNEYENHVFPCEGIVVGCEYDEGNKTEEGLCTMSYNMKHSISVPAVPVPPSDCYWTPIFDVIDVTCTGSCPSSATDNPTIDPTTAPTQPTNNPTKSPTNVPTQPTDNPTRYPTDNPTANPSKDPTQHPTSDPSRYPTSNPTKQTKHPTADPTSDPTMDPTIDPTLVPTYDPTSDPTLDPTRDPTGDPTVDPTDNPSSAPTESPSTSPSIAPTIAPSSTPTRVPSTAPSKGPTGAPSSAPSRAPTTDDAYDSYIPCAYMITGLLSHDSEIISAALRDVIADIKDMVEKGYVDHQSERWKLQYTEFWLKITHVNGKTIDDLADNERSLRTLLNAHELKLTANIECEEFFCNYIINYYNQDLFEADVTKQLNIYFESSTNANADGEERLLFRVGTMSSEPFLLNPPEEESPKYVYWMMIGVTGTLICVGLMAFLFNKQKFPRFPGSWPVDEGKFICMWVFALQFWDFASDVNLSIEIWILNDSSDDVLILIAAIGSTVFAVIPYIANLILATRVKSIIRDNEAAKAYFQQNTLLFSILVVLVGGTYPALALVSSNIFGLKIVSSGLTQYELGNLSKIKVFTTVVLENVPQLGFQVLYASRIGITQGVAIAFFASILSVMGSTLSYLIDRDSADIKAVHYYLSVECKPRTDVSDHNEDDDDEEERNIEAMPPQHTQGYMTPPNATAISTKHAAKEAGAYSYASSFVNVLSGGITEKEKMSFMNHRGMTEQLREKLTELFCIDPKRIQIGSTMITKYGATTHLVHFVYQTDLDAIMEEMAAKSVVVNKDDILITPSLFISQLCEELKDQIAIIFRNHFKLNDEFYVSYHSRSSYVAHKRASAIVDASSKGKADGGGREHILKRIITVNRMRSDGAEEKRSGVDSVLDGFLNAHADEMTDEQLQQRWISLLKDAKEKREKEAAKEQSLGLENSLLMDQSLVDQALEMTTQTTMGNDETGEGQSELYKS